MCVKRVLRTQKKKIPEFTILNKIKFIIVCIQENIHTPPTEGFLFCAPPPPRKFLHCF